MRHVSIIVLRKWLTTDHFVGGWFGRRAAQVTHDVGHIGLDLCVPGEVDPSVDVTSEKNDG